MRRPNPSDRVERFKLHPLRNSGYQLIPDPDGEYVRFADWQVSEQNATGKLPVDHPLVRAENAEAERDELLGAIREHRDTLDEAAAGKPQPKHRDDVDNALYNLAHRIEGGVK